MGYGKRLTFRGDTLNQNDAFFWSDSHPQGFAFIIRAVNDGERFVIYDAANVVVGDAKVEKADDIQMEEKTECTNGAVTKYVRVRLTCSIIIHRRHHNDLIEMQDNNNVQVVEGIAEVLKPKGARQATTLKITDVVLPRVGLCSFWRED